MCIHAKKQRIGLCVVICLVFWGLLSLHTFSQVNPVFSQENPNDTIPPEIHFERLLQLAESHVQNGRIQEAIAAHTEALQYNYMTFGLLVLRGHLFLQQNNFEAALGDFTKAIEIEPDSPLGSSGRYRAMAYEGKAVALGRQVERAVALLDKDQQRLDHKTREIITKFMEAVTKAIDLNPSNANNYIRRAGVFLVIGEPHRALSDLNQALSLGETNSVIYQKLGVAFEQLGRYEDAVAHYDKALALDPSDPSGKASLLGRGYAYGCLEEYDKAVEAYSVALAKHPEDMKIRYRRGGAYSDAGNFSAALQDLQVAMTHGYTAPDLPIFLAYVYYNLGELAKAKKSNAEALSSPHNHVKTAAYFLEGLFALADGRREAAESFYQKGLLLGQTTKNVRAMDWAIDDLEDTIREQKPPLRFREQMLKHLVRVAETIKPNPIDWWQGCNTPRDGGRDEPTTPAAP